jgi:ribosomal protein S18 acetylase RimI-like enzyme
LNKAVVQFRRFDPSLTEKLISYFNQLSPESKSRFGPHPFTGESIAKLAVNQEKYKMYVAVIPGNNSIVAYAIVLVGWLQFDSPRLLSYGLTPQKGDFTFAPSVSDCWQSKGVGSDFFGFILDDLIACYQVKRLILWGGVQKTNHKAIGFYKKHGFTTLGEFEHQGINSDMMLKL